MNHTRLKTFFETIDREVSLDDFKSLYAENVHFKDPLYELYDLQALYHFFQHLYQKVDDPKIVITEYLSEGEIVYIKWTFHYYFHEKQEKHSIEGVSRIVFNEQAKIIEHSDYWDTGKDIYEKFPLLGNVIRWVKKKIRS